MRQSRKEQGLERTGRQLLFPELREAIVLSELEADIASTEEKWGGRSPLTRRLGLG